MVEEARLESVYTPKGYPGFESPSLRFTKRTTSIYVYHCQMKQWQILNTVFPEVITKNIEFTAYKDSDLVVEHWLDD